MKTYPKKHTHFWRNVIVLVVLIVIVQLVTGCTRPEPTVVDSVAPSEDPVIMHEAVSFCLPGPDVNRIKDAFVKGSKKDYVDVMKDPDSECFDIRVQGGAPLKVIPVRKLFDVCSGYQIIMEFWLMQDLEGADLVSWRTVPEGCVPETSA